MNIFKRIKLKVSIETKFLLEQKWGIRGVNDKYAINKSLLKKYLPYNAVIIDCGAHVGADSIEMARIFPKGTIHSFEPVPEVYSHLKKNTRKYPNIVCYKLALSNENGIATMHVSSGESDASSSLLKPTGHLVDHPEVIFKDEIKVETNTLDHWAFENRVSRVDFLWLDMQGFEMEMLKASVKILKTVKAIFTEVSLKDTYQGVGLYKDYKSWLQMNGFHVEREIIPKGTDMGNVLFVRK